MASERIITANPSVMLITEMRTIGFEKLFLSPERIPFAMKSSKFNGYFVSAKVTKICANGF